MKGGRRMKGVTVYRRGTKWAYLVTGGPADPVTGKPARIYQGGFLTEDAAWDEAIDTKRRVETGQVGKMRRIKVKDYMAEWLESVAPALKPTALANYRTNTRAYINPQIGDRWIGDVTVPVLNAFYRKLAESGRRKIDNNSAMYEYWLAHKDDRRGLGPRPAEVSAACGTTLAAARDALRRYRRGRIPLKRSQGLEPKSIKNIHRLIHRAFKDAVAWGYLFVNPAEHAVVPRPPRRKRARTESPWTVDELGRWLKLALADRYDGMWVLAATTGMRRSELGGVHRDLLDLDGEFLEIEDTLVTVDGRAQESDGKSDLGVRGISLDGFTVKYLRRYVKRIDKEREAFGESYPDHGFLMVNEEGRRLHPDTITARFNRLVDAAGVPRIRLHDVRHTYVTLALDAGVNPKLLSDRTGHDLALMLKVYSHASAGRDREAAQLVAGLIEAAIGTGSEP